MGVMEARVRGSQWSHPVEIAVGFSRRLVGLRQASHRACLLIRTRSVHGFGMDRALLIVALDADLTVIGSRVLPPNRVTVFPRARYLLEMPADIPAPELGSTLVIESG